MASSFAVDLVFNSLGAGKLGEATRELQGVDGAAKKAQSSADQLTAAISKQKTVNAQLAGNLRQLKTEYEKLTTAAKASAAAGKGGFDEATISRLRGLSTEIDRTRGALTAGKKSLADNQTALAGIAPAAAGASTGVKGLGAAFNAALGPIGALLAGVAGLTAAFQTLSAQNFAEAKVRTLGTDSAVLVTELKKVSAELNGQASVAELTGAAYDVASAGFVKAADAAMVLKAASLGATGGFSDINTVGNAATSVLNAYGLSAKEAGRVVDQFIQTQNDGKIVVAEYATNIGKVAAAAAGLGIPLSEVNAVIAQATASGVQAEVAFTGLKSALARLASGEAAKDLEVFGIKIDAASIKSDGLAGTLKKLQGLDVGTLFKVLGTEAAPAMLPVIQNLERYEELLKKQEGSAGAAAAAQQQASNTIQGAWKEVTTAFQNLFADQSELGVAIVATLKIAAEAVKVFTKAVAFTFQPIKSIIATFVNLGLAAEKAFDISGKIKQAQAALESFLKAAKQVVLDIVNSNPAFKFIADQVERMARFMGLTGSSQEQVAAAADNLAAKTNEQKTAAEQLAKAQADAARAAEEQEKATKAAAEVTKLFKEDVAKIKDSYNLAGQALDRMAAKQQLTLSVASAQLGAEQALNSLMGERLQREYDAAKTAEQRFNIAVAMFNQQVKAAELEYKQTLLNNDAAVNAALIQQRKVELTYQQMQAERDLAAARGQDVSAYDQALSSQKEVVQLAKEQTSAADQIRKYSNETAQAILQGKIEAAGLNLQTKLASDAIGIATDRARALAVQYERAAAAAIAIRNAAAGSGAPAAEQSTGGVSTGGGAAPATGGGTITAGGQTITLAKGGYVTGPTHALIGEGGESEYVVPESKMGEAMQRYAAGARGNAVIPGSANVNVSYSGSIVNMGGNDYISKGDVPGLLSSAVSQTLKTLQRSPDARRFAGVR